MSTQDQRMERLLSQLQLSQRVAQNSELNSDEQIQIVNKIWNDSSAAIFDSNDGPLTMHELLIDLEVLEKTGTTVSHYLKRVKANTEDFTLREFASKLSAKYIHNGEFDWLSMSQVAAPIINRAPGLPLMLGTFKPNAPFVMPERKRRAPKAKDEVAEKQKPDKVQMVEKDNDSIDAKVKFMSQAMKKCYQKNGNQPFSLYDFLLHPTDFTTTVENIFYFSFVIRDGLAAIEVIDDDLYISPSERGEHNSQIIKKQMIFSITLQKWQQIVKERRITRPAIEWRN